MREWAAWSVWMGVMTLLVGMACVTPAPGDEPLVEPTREQHQEASSTLEDAGPTDTPRDTTPETTPEPAIPATCNGAISLCPKRYNEVAYVTTHNAMSSQEEGWSPPNHLFGLAKQLQAGVHGLMLDVHLSEGKAMMCHGPSAAFCKLGKRPLLDALKELKGFIEAHPGEIFTIIFENYVEASLLNDAFVASGILPYTYAHKKGTPWPTLGEMKERRQQLVVFTDSGGGQYPWLMNVWDHAWETHFSAKTKADLKCDKNRGQASHSLFILNHFLTNPVAKESLAKEINNNPFFLDRAQRCQRQSGQLPNFITVDFYSIGDVFSVVRTLNGL